MDHAKLLLTATLAAFVSFESTFAQSGRYAPTEGEVHAEIVLPRIEDGEAVSLSAYRGKKVLLIHFASW